MAGTIDQAVERKRDEKNKPKRDDEDTLRFSTEENDSHSKDNREKSRPEQARPQKS